MKSFQKILYIAEPGENCEYGLERAVRVAENNQAELTVVAVTEHIPIESGMPDGGIVSGNLLASAVEAHRVRLESLIKPYHDRLTIRTKVLIGSAFLEIIREVLRYKHDLVMKPPEPQVWLARLFGSDDMHLLRKCPCPVWLIKPHGAKAYRRILAALDVDYTCPEAELETRQLLNKQIFEYACSLALSDFAELHIVHAWHAPCESAMHGAFMHTPEEKINAYVEHIRQRHEENLTEFLHEATKQLDQDALDFIKPKTHLVKGRPSAEIPALANKIDADLIIMGTVARTHIPGFIMGNTAEAILNQIDCSVLAIKPPGFITPIRLEDKG